jgi:hypothetical protein
VSRRDSSPRDSKDPLLDADAREAILGRIMARDGISREDAEELLREADAERLRMRDA